MIDCRLWRLISHAVVLMVLSSSAGCLRPSSDVDVLKVSCAASLQKPVAVLAKRFEKLHAVRIRLQFGGTSMLINQAKLSNNADVLISADQFSTDQLAQLNLASECVPLVIQSPVIVTSKSAASKICHGADLLRDDVRLGLGDVQATSIGKATKAGLGSDADLFFQHAVVTRSTVTALATDLKVGSLDAAIVWDSTAVQFGLNTISDVELGMCTEAASACVMSASTQQNTAKDFVQFLTHSQDAEQVFSDLQFRTASANEYQEPRAK